jgi:hypothetical protein
MSITPVTVQPGEILWVPIRVTAEHVARGRRGVCGSCPIALATNERLIDSSCAVVRADEILIISMWPHYQEHFDHPLNGRPSDAIRHFDLTGAMEPFEFMFPLPAYLLKPETQQEAKHLEIERITAMPTP